tara:strand:- start:517 stop:1041 length:525 start_codon:yes stop_codon:yes gene_type:complete
MSKQEVKIEKKHDAELGLYYYVQTEKETETDGGRRTTRKKTIKSKDPTATFEELSELSMSFKNLGRHPTWCRKGIPLKKGDDGSVFFSFFKGWNFEDGSEQEEVEGWSPSWEPEDTKVNDESNFWDIEIIKRGSDKPTTFGKVIAGIFVVITAATVLFCLFMLFWEIVDGIKNW